MPIPSTVPIPQNSRDFELICLEVLRRFWSLPSLDLYAKSGEEQNGLDILDLGGGSPLHAAQCKLKEADKSLLPSEIEAEVEKAKTFELRIGKYAILTTGKVSGQSQRKILKINQAHKALDLFEVELFTWDRLSRLLQTYPEILEQFFGNGLIPNRAARMESALTNTDAVQSATCAYLAGITCVGLAVNAVFDIGWFDSLAAILAVPLLLKEGRAAWRGATCGCC